MPPSLSFSNSKAPFAVGQSRVSLPHVPGSNGNFPSARACASALRRRGKRSPVACGSGSRSEQKVPSREVEELKAEVLRAVAQQRRAARENSNDAMRRVLGAVQALEETGVGLQAPVSGRWTLVYSTQQATQEVKAVWDNEALQAATNSLYKVFFRFAPFLAGSQETGGSSDVRNEQIVDLDAEAVDNIVDVRLPWPPQASLRVRVWGEVYPASRDDSASLPGDLIVTFTGWGFSLIRPSLSDGDGGGSDGTRRNTKKQQQGEEEDVAWEESRELLLPLPRPRGTLCVTFCDETLRISRGGRGGLFVTSRAPTAAKPTTSN